MYIYSSSRQLYTVCAILRLEIQVFSRLASSHRAFRTAILMLMLGVGIIGLFSCLDFVPSKKAPPSK